MGQIAVAPENELSRIPLLLPIVVGCPFNVDRYVPVFPFQILMPPPSEPEVYIRLPSIEYLAVATGKFGECSKNISLKLLL